MWCLVPKDYIQHLKSRVVELERQNGELLDRLLLGAGAAPIQEVNREEVRKSERAVSTLLRELSIEETGTDAAEPLEVESEA